MIILVFIISVISIAQRLFYILFSRGKKLFEILSSITYFKIISLYFWNFFPFFININKLRISNKLSNKFF